uniref:Uncharacterized protein n=1 Tax=Plectus sambesii TaxID=2011161 RepID=A0A914UZS4_9BILA
MIRFYWSALACLLLLVGGQLAKGDDEDVRRTAALYGTQDLSNPLRRHLSKMNSMFFRINRAPKNNVDWRRLMGDMQSGGGAQLRKFLLKLRKMK